VGVTAVLRDWVTRGTTWLAVLFVLMGILFALLEAQSPSRLYWTGQAISATSTGGIVYYRVHGERWTVDDPRDSGATTHRTTVYVDPADPGNAVVQSPTRWADAFGVVGWFVAAVVCLSVPALGRARRRRKRRRASRRAASIAAGEPDSDWFAHYLERSRGPHE
jgi:hypothetical protein